jgi:RNA polymerase sigma-70 factor, ECF subfamily
MTGYLPIDLKIYEGEAELLEGLRRHDSHACACMLKRYAGQIYALALRMMADQDEAEEVLQETFINACSKIDDFQGRSSLGTWLYRIATNAALMRIRKRKPTVSLEDALDEGQLSPPKIIVDWQPDLEQAALDRDLREALEAALHELSEPLRMVFVLRDMQGLSTAETAEMLGISQSAAKVRLHRARLQLRELLSQDHRVALDEYGIQLPQWEAGADTGE